MAHVTLVYLNVRYDQTFKQSHSFTAGPELKPASLKLNASLASLSTDKLVNV